METKNDLGIWMDHSKAYLIDPNSEKKNHSIESKFNFTIKEATLSRSENVMHNKEQQLHEAYYKKIGVEILKYDHVLLFGPTRAKKELYNYLIQDLHFKDITFDIEPADQLTENEKHAFVKNHFENV